VPAAIPGSLVRDQRGISRCLVRKLVGGRPVESSDGGLEPSTPSLPSSDEVGSDGKTGKPRARKPRKKSESLEDE